MSENQLKKIDVIFKPEKMKIRPSVVKLPEQLSLTWEYVGADDNWGGTISPNTDFLENIEKYQENRFLHVGEIKCQTESQHKPLFC